MKIAITGHRPHKLGNDYDLTSPLIKSIKNEIVQILHRDDIFAISNEVQLITGMALGIDTLFALIAIEYNIPFIAAVPFIGQQNKWPPKAQRVYTDIITNHLCTIHYVTQGIYHPSKMHLRNQWMVDNCDLLIAVWDGTSGGTAHCVTYAKSKLKEEQIIIINPLNHLPITT